MSRVALALFSVAVLGGATACHRGDDAHGSALEAPSASASTSSSSAAPGSSARPSAKSAGSAELALVAPLVVGSTLTAFTVQEIRAVERGRLRVVCVKEKARVALDVALASDAEKAMPPATAGRYAVFYELHDATPEDGERLAKALARVLGANASAPAPPGLTVFQPRGDEGVSL